MARKWHEIIQILIMDLITWCDGRLHGLRHQKRLRKTPEKSLRLELSKYATYTPLPFELSRIAYSAEITLELVQIYRLLLSATATTKGPVFTCYLYLLIHIIRAPNKPIYYWYCTFLPVYIKESLPVHFRYFLFLLLIHFHLSAVSKIHVKHFYRWLEIRQNWRLDEDCEKSVDQKE